MMFYRQFRYQYWIFIFSITGSAITNDLTQVLQNRLNESILDIIIGMLSRNPQCMLTPEDVQVKSFIFIHWLT